MVKYTFEAISEEAKENRNYFLNSFKKSYRFNNTLKYGFTAAALASIATGATITSLFASGIISVPFITFTLSVFVPVIAGIVIASCFLAGIVARYLYTQIIHSSKIYSDFYTEFESDEHGLFIDTYNKKKDGKNPLEEQNTSTKIRSIKEWEAICNFEKKTQSFWEDENKIKERYKERFFQALKQNNKKPIEVLSNNRFLKYITSEKDENNNTLLHLAAQKGYIKLVRILIQNIENEDELYAENKAGETPIALAKKEGNEDIAKLIKEEIKEREELFEAARDGDFEKFENIKDYKIKIKYKNKNKNSLLHSVAVNMKMFTNYGAIDKEQDPNPNPHLKEQKRKIAKKLVDKGADINATNTKGDTPLHLAAIFYAQDIIEIFIENGADIYATNNEHYSPFTIDNNIDDITKERNEIFEKCADKKLQVEQINTNTAKIKDKDGNSLLHIAAKTEQLDLVKMLIKKGANVNATNKELETPLHLTVTTGQIDVIKELFKQDANVNAKDINGFTPLHLAVENNGELVSATTKLFIENKKIDINAKDKNKKTPLHLAVEANNKEATEILLNNGADISKQDINGNTPLHSAAKDGLLQIVSLLINSKGSDVNDTNKNGKTPLHLAVENGNPELVQMLIDNEANLSAKDGDGNTPLHLAFSQGNLDIVKILIKNNEYINIPNKMNIIPVDMASEETKKKEQYKEIVKFMREKAILGSTSGRNK